MTDAAVLYARLDDALGSAIVGMADLRRSLTIALLVRGHVLLEGAPGLGKTLLAKSFAVAIGGEFQRVQGTADLMPSDLTGQSIFDQRNAQFSFRPGPVFADVLLADEINRASPKTQSALLEAMAERHVTVDRVRHALPADFLVVATQIRTSMKAPIRCQSRSSTGSCFRSPCSIPNAMSSAVCCCAMNWTSRPTPCLQQRSP